MLHSSEPVVFIPGKHSAICLCELSIKQFKKPVFLGIGY
jgi:hypothetical protein